MNNVFYENISFSDWQEAGTTSEDHTATVSKCGCAARKVGGEVCHKSDYLDDGGNQSRQHPARPKSKIDGESQRAKIAVAKRGFCERRSQKSRKLVSRFTDATEKGRRSFERMCLRCASGPDKMEKLAHLHVSCC